MKRCIQTAVATLAAITLVSLSTAQAFAGGGCGRGRVGISIGHGRVGLSISRGHSYRVPRPYTRPHVVRSQPVYPQPVYVQPTVPAPQPQPVISQQPLPSPAPVAPVATARTQPTQQPQIQTPQTQTQPLQSQPRPSTQQVAGNAAPASTPSNEASALQLLASLAGEQPSTSPTTSTIPQFTAAPASVSSPHAGTWKVNLPGNQSVELVLDAGGKFRWTATKDGKSSSFEGQYRLDTGRLTLVRSSDLQQMAGTWTGQGSKFTFKLDGATSSGLAFVRG